ncbi:hypothetical protein D9C73_007436 [Collichthys lucidus]|uniref:Uncharacterized protein n=1 Tax=Collichthys lucidus TaxID=240159 RepID=A0A4U5UGT1_COLLU|nr:hypothetical protein D9C73_007436 [Collichthys lucidus]
MAKATRTSAMAHFSVRISVFLLLIFMQMLIPYFCWDLFADQRPVTGVTSMINISIQISFLLPIALVPFALLAMLFAFYGKDRSVFLLSLVCQTTSSALILNCITVFLLRNWIYGSWEHMTFIFYIFVGVEIQLVTVTALSHMSWRRLTPDWK